MILKKTMKYQVKCFFSYSSDGLEDYINKFLSELDQNNLFEVDIKCYFDGEKHCAVLLYTTINNSKCDEKS